MKENSTKQQKVSREEKARQIVAARGVILPHRSVAEIVESLKAGGFVLVKSQSDPTRFYRVNGSCQCVDYLRHAAEDPRWRCKHRIAAGLALLEALKTEEAMGGYEPPCPDDPNKRPWTPAEKWENQREKWLAENAGNGEIVEFGPNGGIRRMSYSEM